MVSQDILRSARDFKLDWYAAVLRTRLQPQELARRQAETCDRAARHLRVRNGIGQDFNKIIRFDENDLLIDTNQVTFSLTNRLYAKRGDEVSEIFSWELSAGALFRSHFRRRDSAGRMRNVFWSQIELTPITFLDGPRTYSPVVSVLRGSPVNGITFEWRADYDPARRGIVDSSSSVDFRKGYYFLSLGQNEVHSGSNSDSAGKPASHQLRNRQSDAPRLERGFRGYLRLSRAHLAVRHRAGHLQYGLLRIQRATEALRLRHAR